LSSTSPSAPRLQAEPEEELAHHLDVPRRHRGVLRHDVRVTEAALEAIARVDRRDPAGREQQVDGLRRALGRVRAGQGVGSFRTWPTLGPNEGLTQT
jgi:hypothetical protein